MSELESLPFMGSVDEHTLKPIQPSTLFVQLADDNEWLEQKVLGFKEVVISYHGKECHFTPEEVLMALYAAREMPDVADERIVRCRDCQYGYQHDGKTYPKSEKYKGKWYCIALGDGMQGEWTSPVGFCHRGELRGER